MRDLLTILKEKVALRGLDLAEVHNFNQRTRDRWVAAKAESVPGGSRVLDVGAGTVPYRDLFAHCAYETHDFVQYAGLQGAEGSYGEMTYISDIVDIPVPDASFDVVLCTEVLEHVPRPIEALQKMVRILKPRGRILLTAPLGSGLHQEPFHFYGGYTDHWYRKFLKEFGCTGIEITPNHGFFAHLAQECARVSWAFDKHADLHGDYGAEFAHLMGSVLAPYLYALDEQVAFPEFTVGFHVDAYKG